jgi:3-methyl-2-oxobutanoate hydroxymethyltransferase
MSTPESTSEKRITFRTLLKWVAAGDKFAMLTCYDATTAQWLWRGGIRTMLVGDSAAQVILGHESSIFAPLDFLITLTAGVRRGAPQAFIVGDMPFMSYQADDAEAIRNAGRFMTEGLADAVKLEVDERHTDLVAAMSRAGVPVIAHLGWRPQMARYVGVRTAVVAGRTHQEIDHLVMQAQRMAEAGAVMLLIEQCTAETSQRIVEQVHLPVIGCGAGPACHGHVVVLQDLLGLSDRHPSFVHPVTDLGPRITAAAAQWVELVQSGRYLREDHPYGMRST